MSRGLYPARKPSQGFAAFLISYSKHIMITAQTSFIPRHIGPNEADTAAMLAAIGFDSLDAMTEAIVPADIRLKAPLDLPAPMAEQEALAALQSMLSANKPVRSLIGQGYYGTYLPAVIQRNVYENPVGTLLILPTSPRLLRDVWKCS